MHLLLYGLHNTITRLIKLIQLLHITGPVQQTNPFPRQTVSRVWFGIWNHNQPIPEYSFAMILSLLNDTLGTVWLQFMYAKPYPEYSLAMIYVFQNVPQLILSISIGLAPFLPELRMRWSLDC